MVSLSTSESAHLLVPFNTVPATQVNHWYWQKERRFDYLNRKSRALLKGCAQDFVPLYQSAQAALQRCKMKRARETKSQRDIVPGTLRLPLMQEPQALLRKGERDRMGTIHTLQRGDLSPFVLASCLLNQLCQPCYRWNLKHRSQWHRDVKRCSHSCHQLSRQQGMPSQIEEVLVSSYRPST